MHSLGEAGIRSYFHKTLYYSTTKIKANQYAIFVRVWFNFSEAVKIGKEPYRI
jgi:hypothetical protein